MEHSPFGMSSRAVGYLCHSVQWTQPKHSLCPLLTHGSLFLTCKEQYKAASWPFWCKLPCPTSTGVTSQTSNCCHCDRLPQQIHKQDKLQLLWLFSLNIESKPMLTFHVAAKASPSCNVLLFPCQLPLCCSGSCTYSLLPIHRQNVMLIL